MDIFLIAMRNFRNVFFQLKMLKQKYELNEHLDSHTFEI